MTIGLEDQEPQYWRNKKLTEMSRKEWEGLCDGCGKCCLHKIRKKDGGLQSTNVACRLLDTRSCRCINYSGRKESVLESKNLNESCSLQTLVQLN